MARRPRTDDDDDDDDAQVLWLCGGAVSAADRSNLVASASCSAFLTEQRRKAGQLAGWLVGLLPCLSTLFGSSPRIAPGLGSAPSPSVSGSPSWALTSGVAARAQLASLCRVQRAETSGRVTHFCASNFIYFVEFIIATSMKKIHTCSQGATRSAHEKNSNLVHGLVHAVHHEKPVPFHFCFE